MNHSNLLTIHFNNYDPHDKSLSLLTKPNKYTQLPIAKNHDGSISGHIRIQPKLHKSLKNFTLQVQLIGQIESHPFKKPYKALVDLTAVLADTQTITQETSFPFSFQEPNKFESFYGNLLKIRYFLKVRLSKKHQLFKKGYILSKCIQEFFLQVPKQAVPRLLSLLLGDAHNLIQLSFELNKDQYGLNDMVLGRVKFAFVKTPMKLTELTFIRVETFKGVSEEEILWNQALKEGEINNGEMIPIKLSLDNLNVSSTIVNVEENYSVKYYIRLKLYRLGDLSPFFKRVEVKLYRKE